MSITWSSPIYEVSVSFGAFKGKKKIRRGKKKNTSFIFFFFQLLCLSSLFLPWHPWMAAGQQKPQAPAEEEIPNRSAWPMYSPLVQEVLEAQQCLLVPSPPAKPNPVKHFQEDSKRYSKQWGGFCLWCFYQELARNVWKTSNKKAEVLAPGQSHKFDQIWNYPVFLFSLQSHQCIRRAGCPGHTQSWTLGIHEQKPKDEVFYLCTLKTIPAGSSLHARNAL